MDPCSAIDGQHGFNMPARCAVMTASARDRTMADMTGSAREDAMVSQGVEYILGNRGMAEHERLVAQGTLADPLSRGLLAEAGIARGMRVLDLGCGAGNMAMVAAELVGPDGSVVGIDRDPDALEHARKFVAQAGIDNIEFREGDARTLDGVEPGFDAVIGRLILMYLPDPVEALRRSADRVRPGGIICMHEGDMTYEWASPAGPLWRQVRTWCLDTLARADGVDPRLGLSLFRLFRAAGLPEPRLRLETTVAGGDQAPAWMWAKAVEGLLPVMERLGIATRDDVDPPTLQDRLLAEIVDHDGIVLCPPMFGAWSNVP